MEINDSSEIIISELISVATSIIHDEIHIIEGVRKIYNLINKIENIKNDDFMLIRIVDSETDHFPIGKMRDLCAVDYLQRMDKELDDYLVDMKDEIFKSCRKIIHTFSEKAGC